MKPTARILAVLMVFALLLTGCAAAPQATPTPTPEVTQEATPTPAATDEPTAEPAEAVVLNAAALNGPTGLGMAHLMKESETTDFDSFDPTFALASAPDEITSRLLSGEADIAAVPTNLAAVLYNKTEGGVKLLALNTLGVLYVLEKGDSVQSIADLAGKTVYSTGEASMPEYIIDYILEGNELTDSVTVEYLAQHAELAAMAVAGDVDVCILPEPFVSQVVAKNPDMRVALSLTDEWNALSGGAQLSMGCLVVRTEYYEAHPEAVAEFMEEYAASASFATTQVEETAKLAVEYGIIADETLATAAIPRCNIVCLTGEDMKSGAQAVFDVLYSANPASVGGKLPGDDFYLTSLAGDAN